MGFKARAAKAPPAICTECFAANVTNLALKRALTAVKGTSARLRLEEAAMIAESTKLRADLAKEQAEVLRLRALLDGAFDRTRRYMSEASALRTEMEHAAKEITLLHRLLSASEKGRAYEIDKGPVVECAVCKQAKRAVDVLHGICSQCEARKVEKP